MIEHLARYRGSLTGLDADGSTLVFSTEHEEGQSTSVFFLDLDARAIQTLDLDGGATAQLLDGDELWIAGTDRRLLRGGLDAVGEPFESRVVAMASFEGGVAVVAGDALHLVAPDGARKTFALGEPGRSVASDPSGEWIVVGTTRGHVCVFNGGDGEFVETGRARLHDGQVTALAFAPDELRVYTTGTDCRLLVSYVRGSFDTEDRGRNDVHEREVRALVMGPDFETESGTRKRFYTAGLDSTIKAWPRNRSGSQRPATQGDGVVQTSALAVVELEGKPHLAAAGLDASIRVFAFDPEGSVGEQVVSIRDAYALARDQLGSSKPKDRLAAMEELAGYADAASLPIISRHVLSQETDHKLRVRGVELIASVEHPQTAGHLEEFFGHPASEVRVAAFEGLRAVRGPGDVEVLRKGADSGQEDLGLLAVEGALVLGSDAAVELIRETLDHSDPHVRIAALTALESHFGATPDGTLAGLESRHADVRRTAIVRLQKRGLLGNPTVDARLRRLWDDADERARLWAFVVSMHRRPKLVKALRAVDDDFHRQVFELEEFGKEEKNRRTELPEPKSYGAKKLSEADFRPLLEAMGSRSIDVCLRGAMGLAGLGDERSFGALLQLSRESDASSRVAVCKGLRVLGDPRSIKRVRAMLHDTESQVRGAAFTALTSLQADAPLATARSGLSVRELDIRSRALALLVATLRDATEEFTDEARELLRTALNDDAATLRQEAFKSVLHLEPNGGGPATLRFILQSVHADVRNEVLQEAKARPDDEDYRELVLAIIDDPDASNRAEALNYALERWPSEHHRRVFRAALGSRHVSQRVAAVRKLSEEKGEIRTLLLEALADEDTLVRLEAVRALVGAENRPMLVDAMMSEHLDVRVEAASALAVLGDERALSALLDVIAGYHELHEERAAPDEIERYRPALESALSGIARLGHPESVDAVLSLLDQEESIASAAAATLPAIAHPSNLARIRTVANHDSAYVRLLAGLALAYNGDASSAPIVFSKADPYVQLLAALGLRHDAPERFLSFVDSADAHVRSVALGLTLALELSEHTTAGVPERCLSLLSAGDPQIRLRAAQALEQYGDQPTFYRTVYSMLNALKSPADAWEAEPRVLLALSRAVTFGEPRLAVRAAQILALLTRPDRDDFDKRWTLFEERFSDALAVLEKRANERRAKPPGGLMGRAWHRLKETAKSIVVEPTSFVEALQTLAFGAYVGIARQQTGDDTYRIAALTGLARIAPSSERFRADAVSVMLLALGDPSQSVRERAFEALEGLNASREVLSTEALSTGFSDMGFRGLELLASDSEGGEALLARTLTESTNGLELEAAKLLAERVGWIEVHRIGLGAASEAFRARSISGLGEEYAASDDAEDALREALSSRHDDVRYRAANWLARRKDEAAFDTLAEQVRRDDGGHQREAVIGFRNLRDPRAAGVLLERVENDPENTAQVATLLDGAAAFGDASVAPRLISLIDADEHRSEAFDAALELSGYRQYEWVDDEDVTPEWEAAQRPRHPAVFAQLFDLAYRIADEEMLGELVGLAKWPGPSDDVDSTLAALLEFSHDHIRHRAVEIAGWRARHRGGPTDGLKNVLSSSDPLDQLYAAEGLALAGHDDGLAVLRTAIDAIDDWSLRERAVGALGQLADPSTVDMLLEFASDDAHPLQRAAAEAIGHMSESERADEVFSTLERLATSGQYEARRSALAGLRWFGSPGAWDILRREAKSDEWWVAQRSVELLRFDDDSTDVVADVLRETDDWDVAREALESLRHLWGPDSLEPDYLRTQANIADLEGQDEAIARLRESGDVGRILTLLSEVQEHNESSFVPPLVAVLLSRSPLPVAQAAPMLDSDRTRTAAVAAQIVGRAGPEAANDHGDALLAATRKANEAWNRVWTEFVANRRGARERLAQIGARYRRLVWACGQLHIGQSEILTAAALPDHELAIGIREDAISSLGEAWFGSDGIEALVKLAHGSHARLRSMAAAELDRSAPDERASLIEDAVHDDVSFGRLLSSLDSGAAREPLRDAVKEAAGVSLPRLAALGDVDGLVAAMRNTDLPESTRRGAIDALGTIASETAAHRLAAFGADEETDEMLRKAAWRARRRVTRAVAAREEAP